MIISSIDYNLIGSSLIWGVIILVIVKTLRNKRNGNNAVSAKAAADAAADATGGTAGARAETGAINVYLVVGNSPTGTAELTNGNGGFLVSPNDPAIAAVLSRLQNIKSIDSGESSTVVEFN